MVLKVQENNIVDIIFPATSCSKSEVENIKNYTKNELNLTPRILLEEKLIFNEEKIENEFPKNSPKERFNQLKLALENSDSKIIWCARGGYGSGDLLPFLEELKPIKQNKLFIGFSDIVSISNFLQEKWHWQIICAPVLLQLARKEIAKEAENELKNLLFAEKENLEYELENLNENQNLEGEIIGGCLSVLAGHFGGKYQINFADKILFLEDEGEDGERLDRYFRQIIELILKTKTQPKAILLGNFLQANPHGTPKAKNIKIALNNFVTRIADTELKIPIFKVKDDNLGHSNKMRPLILGKKSNIINYKLTTRHC